ncbi:flagellar hook-length control protein FliK [Paracandidimonas soli]|uniref:Flagellar hook-length control protein FliK n=1 Tax=Paracandidimonas soli TaxID=1917182 RepID=A0A4R3VB47_9BURK|nr:flagellar hook-length control protein FliK [Paracandidimonas soli]TCV00824.1 flagellar hook-length control protein FliK [Paracandidimonas soli]
MTVPILTASPLPAANGQAPNAAREDNAGNAFSDALSGSRQSLSDRAVDRTSPAKQGATERKDGKLKDAAGTEADDEDLALPGLALAIAEQAASLLGPQETLRENAQPSGDKRARGNIVAASNANDAPLRSIDISASPETPPVVEPGAGDADPGLEPVLTAAQQQRASTAPANGRPAFAEGLNAAAGRGAAGRHPAQAGSAQAAAAASEPSSGTLSSQAMFQAQQADALFAAPAASTQAGMELPAAMAAGLASIQPQVSSAIGPASAPAITVPLQHPQWPQAMGQQFLHLLQSGGNHGTQVAELRLDPPDLGPLRISIQLSDNVAHAVFVSAHAPVRQALEQALPQLQEQLAQAGISLGQTSVNDQDPRQAEFFQQQGDERSGVFAASDGDVTDILPQPVPNRAAAPNALVDTFA